MSLSLILLLPLVGFILNGLLQLGAGARRNGIVGGSTSTGATGGAKLAGIIGTCVMVASFAVVLIQEIRLLNLPADGRIFEETLFQWIQLKGAHGLSVDFSLRFDSLSSIFALVITGVGTLIHLYSVAYMKDDATPARFFAYLNLFCFFMLTLVLGTSLPVVFLGWEGVGLASYLLIGYWFSDPEKVKAGQKAFIMNRVGDLGFLVAMFIAFQQVGSLDLLQLNSAHWSTEGGMLTAFGLAIFFACTGKSAQIPLFTWLPDAMAGPTPVSALIHAATMVTSGVYLLTRLSVVISSSPVTMSVIALVGGLTAFLAATIACAQSDIKKILAYSTVSQLGFMFLGCGVGAFDAGVFHVMTHAFFKALLFLGAGSVIHALHEEQNVFKMGDLRKKMPITAVTFGIGTAAITGILPFSGFFSKDEIIFKSLTSPSGGGFLFGLAIVSAFLTAFYMTRLFVLVFFSPNRVEKERAKKVHESPLLMTVPLMILAILSLVGGWFGAPYGAEEGETAHSSLKYGVMAVSWLVAVSGCGIAYFKYKQVQTPEKPISFLEQGWGIDFIYQRVFGGGTESIAKALDQWIEEGIFQRALRWSGAVAQLSGTLLRSFQAGSIQAYLMMILVCASVALFVFVFGWGPYGKL